MCNQSFEIPFEPDKVLIAAHRLRHIQSEGTSYHSYFGHTPHHGRHVNSEHITAVQRRVLNHSTFMRCIREAAFDSHVSYSPECT